MFVLLSPLIQNSVPLRSSVDHCSLPAGFILNQHGTKEIYVGHTGNVMFLVATLKIIKGNK